MSKTKIPITIVTGFLGSGKTTFLNRILQENKDKRIGLLLNEFGSISLESEFIVSEPGGIVEFDGGCLCHAPINEIISSIKKILSLSNKVDHIIIEASGLTNPLPVMQLINGPELKDLLVLDTIICLVDAVNFKENSSHRLLMQGQLLYANYVILTKTDLISVQQTEQMKKELMGWASDLEIIDLHQLKSTSLLLSNPQDFSFLTSEQDLDLLQISKENNLDPAHSQKHDHNHEHNDFVSEIIVHKGHVNVKKITQEIKAASSSITRIKAVLYNEQPSQYKWLVHKVGAVIDVKRVRIPPNDYPINKILLVGSEVPSDYLLNLKSLVAASGTAKSPWSLIKRSIMNNLTKLSYKVKKIK